MSKFSKFLLLFILITLTACNRPQSVPNGLPSDSDLSDGSTDTPQGNTTASETQPSTSASQITATPEIPDSPDEIPPEPTIDMTQVLAGNPIQLLSAGSTFNLVDISMVNTTAGWGIGGVGPDYFHVFTTADGGLSWQDVSPPQPGTSEPGAYIYVEYGVWDEYSAWVAYSGAEYVWATHDGGISWEASPLVFTTTGDGMFEVLDEDHVWFFQFLEGGMQKIFTAVNRSDDGGATWDMILSPYDDATIQSFTKTGLDFISPQYGWLTRDFRGVDPFVRISFSQDGGTTWDAVEIPPPPSLPDLFQTGLGDLFDPYLIAQGEGYFRLFGRYFENELMIDRNFLYKTNDVGSHWDILEIPAGDIYYIDDQILYSVSRDIYRSIDSGLTWQKMKSVNWDGKFSFVDKNTALGIAHDAEDNEYALVKTTDGCQTFIIIEPLLLEPERTVNKHRFIKQHKDFYDRSPISKLADVLVQYSTKIKAGEWVMVYYHPLAELLAAEVYRAVLQAGGYPTSMVDSDLLSETLHRFASDDQLLWRSPLEELAYKKADVAIVLMGSDNTRYMSNLDPAKQRKRAEGQGELLNIMMDRTGSGDFRWVMTQYPCQSYAQDADMSLTDFEEFIHSAMFTDQENPVASWKEIHNQQQKIVDWLKGKKQVTVKSPNADLRLSIEGRDFINADGTFNMPSGEVYTSPVEDSAEGWVEFTYPAIHLGREVTGVRFEIEKGKVIKASADKNEEFLLAMLDADEGARVIGEFAIGTNYGIQDFTGSILFDEKIGGSFNIATGLGFPEIGGKNVSAIHWDFICDIKEGSEIRVDGELLYKDGQFMI